MQNDQHKLKKTSAITTVSISKKSSITTYSKRSFVESYDPKKCLWHFRDVPNIHKMFSEFGLKEIDDYSIKSIMVQFGEKWTIMYLQLWVADLLDFLNLKRSMKVEQIKETAFHIATAYSKLSIVDITLVFRRLKQGFYGEFYSSIDGSKILIAFKRYSEERSEVEFELKQKQK